MESTAPRRRRWPLLLAAAALAGAAVVLTQGADDGEVHALPPRGEVAAVMLDRGRPVFIVHAADGAVRAFDARAPVHAGRRRGLVTWCEPNGVFVDPLSGHSWEADGSGRVLRGTLPRSDLSADRPPPPLRRLPVETSQGRVRLTAPAAGQRPVRRRPPSARASCPEDGSVDAPLPGEPASPGRLAADELPRQGVWRLTGRLEETTSGPPRLCPQGPLSEPCGQPALTLALPPPERLPDGLVRRRRVEAALSLQPDRPAWLLVGASGPVRLSHTAAPAGASGPVGRPGP